MNIHCLQHAAFEGPGSIAACEHQAFVLGDKAAGLQFHPAMADLLDRLVENGRGRQRGSA